MNSRSSRANQDSGGIVYCEHFVFVHTPFVWLIAVMSRKRAAVLGGTRFIGVHLVQILLKNGFDVTLFNRGITREPQTFETGHHTQLHRIRGERSDPDSLARLFQTEYDVVFDLSGFTTAQIQPLVTRYRSQIGQYIFCSTSSVYRSPFPSPLTEDSPREFAGNTYGGEKALAENFLTESWLQHGFPTTVLRAHGVFGMFDPAHMGFIFSRMLRKSVIPIRAGCDTKTRFLYVQDFVRCALKVFENKTAFGKAYNLVGDEVVTPRQLIELCGKVATISPRVQEVATASNVGLQWLSYDLVPDNSRIKSELRFEFTALPGALRETWNWLKNDPIASRPQLARAESHVLTGKPVPVWLKGIWWLKEALRLGKLKRRLKQLRQHWVG